MTPEEFHEMETLRRAHALMVAQFKVMQREKEHGWKEADLWEGRAALAEKRIKSAWFEGYQAGAGRPAYPPDCPYL